MSAAVESVAAIAASLVLSRSEGTSAGAIPAGESLPGAPSLDKLRAAGL